MVEVLTARWVDLLYLRQLRNNSRTRPWFRQTEVVPLHRHIAWFFSRGRRREEIYIIWIEERRVGYARLRGLSPHRRDISLAIEPHVWGQGVGLTAIKILDRQLRASGDHSTWQADVRRENQRSKRLFLAAGFVIFGHVQIEGSEYLRFIKAYSQGNPGTPQISSKDSE